MESTTHLDMGIYLCTKEHDFYSVDSPDSSIKTCSVPSTKGDVVPSHRLEQSEKNVSCQKESYHELFRILFNIRAVYSESRGSRVSSASRYSRHACPFQVTNGAKACLQGKQIMQIASLSSI